MLTVDLLISMLAKSNLLHLSILITPMLVMLELMGLPLKKSSFKMQQLSFSSKLDLGSYIALIAKKAPEENRALI